MPIPQPDDALLERFLGPVRATIARTVWDAEVRAGGELTQERVIALVDAPVTNP